MIWVVICKTSLCWCCLNEGHGGVDLVVPLCSNFVVYFQGVDRFEVR